MYATGLYIQLPECAEDFCPLAHFWAYYMQFCVGIALCLFVV